MPELTPEQIKANRERVLADWRAKQAVIHEARARFLEQKWKTDPRHGAALAFQRKLTPAEEKKAKLIADAERAKQEKIRKELWKGEPPKIRIEPEPKQKLFAPIMYTREKKVHVAPPGWAKVKVTPAQPAVPLPSKKMQRAEAVKSYEEARVGHFVPMPSQLALAKSSAGTQPLTATAPTYLPSFMQRGTQPENIRLVLSGIRNAAMVSEANAKQARQWGLQVFRVPHSNFTGAAAENNAYIVYRSGEARKAKEVVRILEKYPPGKRGAEYYNAMGVTLGAPKSEVDAFVKAYYGQGKQKSPVWLGVLSIAAVALLFLTAKKSAGTISQSYSGWLGDYLDWDYINHERQNG
jgi:hypothetical protein